MMMIENDDDNESARPLLSEEPAFKKRPKGKIGSTFKMMIISASTTDILTYEAWRQSKDAREIISRNFSLNIDDLFTLLFTNSKFFYDFQVVNFTNNIYLHFVSFLQAERKTSDIVQCPWQHSDQSEDKFREVV